MLRKGQKNYRYWRNAMIQGKYIGIFIVSFLLSVLLAIIIIPILRKIKFGQTIREDGPKTHLKKMGIPTMGGFIFLLPLVVLTVVLFPKYPDMLPLTFAAVTFGFIGFIDDYIKVVKKRKDGLYPKQKTLLQIVFGTIFAFYVVNFNIINDVIHFPYFDLHLPKPVLILYIILFLYFISNAVNLTDGVDGLLASITIVVLLAFTVVTLGRDEFEYIRVFCIILIGACAGYLIFNRFPASVIMGDLGSLGLGGAVAAISILLKTPVIILFFGVVYIIEAFSVIIQVASFKLRGKRVFKMAPVHHHFELQGWKETRIVKVFTGITSLFCLLGILIYNFTVR